MAHNLNLGVVPLALQFAISVGAWMVKSRISAATAANYAAAEFDYFKRVSDAELTGIAFEMARQFPQYPYYEWFRILQDLRRYGAFVPGQGPAQPPPDEDKPPEDEKPASYGWLLGVLAVVVFVLVTSEG